MHNWLNVLNVLTYQFFQIFPWFPILFAPVALLYIYFWLWLIYSWFNPKLFFKKQIHNPLPPKIKLVFQFTTKGGNPEIVARGIWHILHSNLDPSLYQILVATEEKQDMVTLKEIFPHATNLNFTVVPPDYQTPKKSGLKSRNLQYAIEAFHKKLAHKDQTYIVHFDEESVIPSRYIEILYHEINREYYQQKDILCGPINYPLEYTKASVWSRGVENNRLFIVPEAAIGCLTNLPKQGYGSNMAVRASMEIAIGWDIGLCENQPIIAEDILFLLLAKARQAKLGWHGVLMLEQPAFTPEQSYRQRYRWVFGILQSLAVFKNFPEATKLSPWSRRYIIFNVWLRCMLYGLGFIYGFLGTLANIILLILIISNNVSLYFKPVSTVLLILWAASFQYGTYWHLKYQLVPWWFKFREHLLVFLTSPILGLLDTFPTIKALWDWYVLRKRSVIWQPTVKNLQKESLAKFLQPVRIYNN